MLEVSGVLHFAPFDPPEVLVYGKWIWCSFLYDAIHLMISFCSNGAFKRGRKKDESYTNCI